MTKRNLILLVIIALAILGMGIGLGRCTKTVPVREPVIDVSKYEKVIDSILLKNKEAQITIDQHQIQIDSLQKSLKNKPQYVKEIKQIQNFTSVTRAAWLDSVLRAEGIR